ncbi:hypothetical protein CBG25_16885 [Arsenophonus sp. ENCA]|uniref:hypothetical protein n=1 Tax=Arsenophonus sp. ENCA TaxID=1987579 RepID=UPI000BD12226|nr:hypothetical protein [Arsenophonus sp. ENCA]PAV01401.1 hypothetical protein CBG25_16885 [Arsenophonus sp. ENCA]
MSITSIELNDFRDDINALINSGINMQHVYQALAVMELRKMYKRMEFMGDAIDRIENELEQVNTNIRNLQQ